MCVLCLDSLFLVWHFRAGRHLLITISYTALYEPTRAAPGPVCRERHPA